MLNARRWKEYQLRKQTLEEYNQFIIVTECCECEIELEHHYRGSDMIWLDNSFKGNGWSLDPEGKNQKPVYFYDYYTN